MRVASQVALLLAVSVFVGMADALVVVTGVMGARGAFQHVPLRIWFISPLTWAAVGLLAWPIVFAIARRRAGAATAVVLITAFFGIRLRAASPLVLMLGLCVMTTAIVVVWKLMSRWTERSPRAIAALAIGVLCVAAIGAATGADAPRRGTRDADAGAPNLIVVFLDTVRYDAVFRSDGATDDTLPTLGGLVRASIVYERAYAPSPWTMPSHFAAVTGLPVERIGIDFDRQIYAASAPTLAERYRARGYRTAAVISNLFLARKSGFERGFDTFEQAVNGLDLCRTAPGLVADKYWPRFAATVCNWSANEVTRRALTQMNDDDGPFLLVLNYMTAHDPYFVEDGCDGPDGYANAVRCLDRKLAPIVDWRSQKRDTILAVVGDHGEQFGEHGLHRHGNSVYVQLLHVPFMIRRAGFSPARVRTPVSIEALPALLEDPGALRAGGPVTGMLVPPRATGLGSQWSALDEEWHLVVRERGGEELFHLPSDPAEARNVVGQSKPDRLRSAIDAMRRVTPPGDAGRFRSLGYIH